MQSQYFIVRKRYLERVQGVIIFRAIYCLILFCLKKKKKTHRKTLKTFSAKISEAGIFHENPITYLQIFMILPLIIQTTIIASCSRRKM